MTDGCAVDVTHERHERYNRPMSRPAPRVSSGLRPQLPSAPGLGVAAALAFAACGKDAPDADPATRAPAKVAPTKSAADPAPPSEPAPAPDGAVALRSPDLYVQTCDAEHACPKLLQAAGDDHCGGLDWGGLKWRLPEHTEAKRFAGAPGLQDLETFHWTRTPYAEDDAQVWVVDPKSGQETTLQKTRKPFVVRCVADPKP